MDNITTHDVEHILTDTQPNVLTRLTSAIETATTLDELLLLALHEFASLLGSPLCGIILLNDDQATAQLAAIYPPRVEPTMSIPLENMVHLRRMVADREIIQIDDVATATGITPATRQLLDRESICSLVLVPLVAQDRVSGAIVFTALGQPQCFPRDSIMLARLMAGLLAAAIASFQITEKAQHRSAELATLNEITAAVTSSLNTREVYHLVMENLNEYFQVEAGSLLMVDDETNDLEFVMTLEAGEEKLAGVRVPKGQGVAGYVAETQHYDLVHDAQNDPRFYSKVSEDVGYVTKTILCVPMVVKGRTIGVIELLNKRGGLFTETEAIRLTRMAATIGVAIENARLFQQVTTVRDRFEAILNSTTDGILMVDMWGVTITANPMAAQVLRYRRSELIGRPLSAILEELHARAISVSTPSWFSDDEQEPDLVEFELGGAQRYFVRHFILPVREGNGTEIGRLAMFQDISKERELAQLREDYTGMLVHDLRAPLTAIMNGIMMVKRGLGGPISEQQSELLGIAHHGSQTMLEMVNTMLDISKMEQGRMPLDIEPLSPYALADEALDRLRVSAQRHNIQLDQQLAVNLPLIEADREKLVRVLQNLIDNAIKFSPLNATVTLGAARLTLDAKLQTVDGIQLLPRYIRTDLRAGDWIVFWVRDQGPGVPPQYHERIFEKFGQVGGHKVRGTGLGLTFCKLAVESHNGRIWLESIAGEGSTFAFVLPLARDNDDYSPL